MASVRLATCAPLPEGAQSSAGLRTAIETRAGARAPTVRAVAMAAILWPACIHRQPLLAVPSVRTQNCSKRAATATARASKASLGRAKLIWLAKMSLFAGAPARRMPTVARASPVTSARASAFLGPFVRTATPPSALTDRKRTARPTFAMMAVARLVAKRKTIVLPASSVTVSAVCQGLPPVRGGPKAAIWRARRGAVRCLLGLACSSAFGSREGTPAHVAGRVVDAARCCGAPARS